MQTREPLLIFLYDLIEAKLLGLHLVVTSRREKDIEEHFGSLANQKSTLRARLLTKISRFTSVIDWLQIQS